MSEETKEKKEYVEREVEGGICIIVPSKARPVLEPHTGAWLKESLKKLDEATKEKKDE